MTDDFKLDFTPFQPDADDEWYTPAHIIDFARDVMDGIALDPASSREANAVVGATHFFTIHDDGLAQSWHVESGEGGVFVNPPYSKGFDVTGKWWRKMKAEWDAGHFDTGLFLANAKTETRWFQDALNSCPVLLIKGRLSFWRGARASRKGFFGSALVLLSRPLYSDGSPTPYKAADPALSRFLALGQDLGQVVIAT